MTNNQQLATIESADYTPTQLDLIRSTVAAGTSPEEFQLFVEVCKMTGLNPFARQIYAIMRSDGKDRQGNWKPKKMTIQTGIDGYRLLAARTGALAGIDDAIYDTEEGAHPNKASVTVYRLVQGQRVPFTATARWSEYAVLDKDGNPTGLWAKMPFLMLGKCAEALAERKAFPAELSGVYTAEEMGQADNPPPTAYVESEHFPATPEKLLNPQRDPNYQRRPYRIEDDSAAEHVAKDWNPITDVALRQALNRLGVRKPDDVKVWIESFRQECAESGVEWTSANAIAAVNARIELDNAQRIQQRTPDLSTLDTGAVGN